MYDDLSEGYGLYTQMKCLNTISSCFIVQNLENAMDENWSALESSRNDMS